jgi:hypothetical protein
MLPKRFLFYLIITVLSGFLVSLSAQVKITDGAVLTLDANSLLELESTNKGFLIPRMAINNLNLPAPLTAPVPAGMLVYSSGGAVNDGFYFWDGTSWKKFVQSTVQISEGGTGSTTKVWVDLSSDQTAAGAKTWSSLATFNAGLTSTGGVVNLNNSSNFATNINTGTSTGTITLGGTAAQTISVGNGAGIKTVNLGSNNSTSNTTLLSGTGGTLSLNASGGGAVTNIGTGTTTGNIYIGGASNSVFLPGFSSAGIVHNSPAGLLSSSLIVNSDITNATIDLTTKVTGILPVPNGGTGLSTGTSGGIPAYTGSTTITSSGVLTSNALMIGGGAGSTPSTIAIGNPFQVVAVNSAGTGYTHRNIRQQIGTWGFRNLRRNQTNVQLLMVAVGGTSMTALGSRMGMAYNGRIVGINVSGGALCTAGSAQFTVFKNGTASGVSVTIDSGDDPPYDYSVGGTDSFVAGDILDIRYTSTANFAPDGNIEYVAWIIIEWTD